MELSIPARFELERHNRLIDATNDVDALRQLSKQLLQAWHAQKAASEWMMRQQLGKGPNQAVINAELDRKAEIDKAREDLFKRAGTKDPEPTEGYNHPL
jgi:hypothetical protein